MAMKKKYFIINQHEMGSVCDAAPVLLLVRNEDGKAAAVLEEALGSGCSPDDRVDRALDALEAAGYLFEELDFGMF